MLKKDSVFVKIRLPAIAHNRTWVDRAITDGCRRMNGAFREGGGCLFSFYGVHAWGAAATRGARHGSGTGSRGTMNQDVMLFQLALGLESRVDAPQIADQQPELRADHPLPLG